MTGSFDEKTQEINHNVGSYFTCEINTLIKEINLNEKIVNALKKIQDDVKREILYKCENLEFELERK